MGTRLWARSLETLLQALHLLGFALLGQPWALQPGLVSGGLVPGGLGMTSFLGRTTIRTQGPLEQVGKLRPRGAGRSQWSCLRRMPCPTLDHPYSSFSKLRIWLLSPGSVSAPRSACPAPGPAPLVTDWKLGSWQPFHSGLQKPPRGQRDPTGHLLCDLGEPDLQRGRGRIAAGRSRWDCRREKAALEPLGPGERWLGCTPALYAPHPTPPPTLQPSCQAELPKGQGLPWGKESSQTGFLRPSAVVREWVLGRGAGGVWARGGCGWGLHGPMDVALPQALWGPSGWLPALPGPSPAWDLVGAAPKLA